MNTDGQLDDMSTGYGFGDASDRSDPDAAYDASVQKKLDAQDATERTTDTARAHAVATISLEIPIGAITQAMLLAALDKAWLMGREYTLVERVRELEERIGATTGGCHDR